MSKFSLRQAYGEVLRELGAENSDIVALEADLANQPCPACSKMPIRSVISKWE